MPPKKEPVKFKVVRKRKATKEDDHTPAKKVGSTKAGFVKKEIAKGNLKKEGSKIVSTKAKTPTPKAPAKKGKLLSKKALVEEIENGDNKDMTDSKYDDHITDYRNDYPEVAQTDKQMEKLSNYATRQINKQIFDYYKANKGSLKGFKVKNIYGKAF